VHALEDRLRRAETPEEAPSALEDALGGVAPTPTPIRLETPIEPPLEPPRPTEEPPEPATGAETLAWGARTPPPQSPILGPEPTRPGPPAAFSLEAIREATEPSADDLPMPEGTVEPGPPGPGEEADQPEFTRRAGLGVSPGLTDDADVWDTPPPRRSKGGWMAAFLGVLAVGAAAAAYFEVWVPAQEEKLRQEAQRARLEESERARAAADAEVRERERKAKEEFVTGMAARADGGVAVDAGAGGSAAPPEAPRGAAEAVRAEPPPAQSPPPTPAPAVRTAVVQKPVPPAKPRPAAAAEPRAHTFDEWMALADRDREHAKARAAVDAYDRAIAADGSRPEAYVGQGRAHLDLGDPKSAISAFRRALMVNSRYSVAEFWLGEAYRRVGQSSQAVEAYGRYLEASPEGAEAPRAREALNALK
jgi:tetratricopeptide (TPR) repeat protein